MRPVSVRRRSGFGVVSARERREAEAFFADLMGWTRPGSPLGGTEGEGHLGEPEDLGETGGSPCPPAGPLPSRCIGITERERIQCFDFESASVLPRHQPQIVGLARCILASQSTANPITTLHLVGHTDGAGSAAINDPLGLRRAEAVKSAILATLNRMTGNHAPRITITTATRGSRDLLPGDPALSRRVEVFPPFAFPVLCPTDFLVAPAAVTLAVGDTAILRVADRQPIGRGSGTYTWRTTSTRLALGSATSSPQTASGPSVTVRAGTQASPTPEVVEVTRSQPRCAPMTKRVPITITCQRFRLARPRVIATAVDRGLRPTATFTDPTLLGGYTLGFGQDLSFSSGRTLPHGMSVGSTPADLESKMRRLLTVFASNDTTGKARRLFDAFLTPRRAVTLWTDPDLTAAAQTHPNIASFVSLSLNGPTSSERASGRTRIHQALENAAWDINRAVAPTDLGVPAFNRGSKPRATEDFGNGLGVMINGLQHAIVVARDYSYDACRREYTITLQYVFYDVFGLDDDDLREFGADGGLFDSTAAEGITAWWQLQHQHGYAPLITRIEFERRFTVPARPWWTPPSPVP